MALEITGVIHEIYPTHNVSATFQKREMVLMANENPAYPQYIIFQFIQDRCALLDRFKKGDEVSVSFELKGKAYAKQGEPTRYFNTIDAWRIRPKMDFEKAGQELMEAEARNQESQHVIDFGKRLNQ